MAAFDQLRRVSNTIRCEENQIKDGETCRDPIITDIGGGGLQPLAHLQ
ncbi:MAG: hypothetical protein HRU36_03310 [Rickettsiales bacterium]|nr:hypothetical protein [Rickettsiales bacterium]